MIEEIIDGEKQTDTNKELSAPRGSAALASGSEGFAGSAASRIFAGSAKGLEDLCRPSPLSSRA